MKRKSLFIVLFVVGFAAVYMIMSFAIPGFRIKLEAEPVLIGGLPLVLGKRK